MHGTKVTIIIPVHNREGLLEVAVRSVLSTGYPALEILIVDDGSTDGSPEVAARLAAQYPTVIRLLRHPGNRNRGTAASRDLGINEATGQYIAFLDSDDYVFPHRLETAVRLLDERPDIDGVYETTKRMVSTGGGERAKGVRPLIDFRASEPARVLEQIISKQRHWSVNAILLRRATLRRAGGFTGARYPDGPEDLFLWLKLACCAKLTAGSGEPVAVYRMHASNISSAQGQNALIGPLHSYLSATHWAKGEHLHDCLSVLRSAVKEKMYFVVSSLRTEGCVGLTLQTLWRTMAIVPTVALERRYWANLALALLRR
jgi:glycosyltransferase involved in cell wall biosynthesis